MPLDSGEVITEEAVRAQVEQLVQEDLLWRRAFKDLDVTGIDSNSFKVPQHDDTMGNPEAVAEGSELPRDEPSYSKVTIDFELYGFEVPITRQARQTATMDVVTDSVERQTRQMSEFLNEIAFNELNNNLHTSSPAGNLADTGALEFNDIVDGLRILRESGYSPEFVIVDTQGEADLLTSTEFTHASDLGDETLTTGQIGRIAGLDVFSSNAGHLGSQEGIIVDPEFYGYEAIREGMQTRMYEEPESLSEVLQLWTQRGYKGVQTDAAIKVQA